jgi:adenine-specific DNA methylase
MIPYPKRLIEVDLPIKKISEHARREKSIRHGHISTLHIWWARRPLAACRAVICAALWPDPAQDDCPPKFREDAAAIMARFWNPIGRTDLDFHDPMALRKALLDFIADFSNWDNSTKKEYLETARSLTQSAHEALGGAPGTRPLVADPFAGGGSIPLEALRVGADAFASDLNPVAVLLNKVVLEYIPKYGQTLADEVRKWGEWIKVEAEKELGQFYPKDPDGATPIAYLWARTVTCEGPGCGAEVPLMRSLWLAKKSNHSVALHLVPRPEAKRVDFRIIAKQYGEWVDQDNPKVKIGNPNLDGTVKRGSATCPCCGYTTPVSRVREQLKSRKGGASDAQLCAIAVTKQTSTGRFYRLPGENDFEALKKAAQELERRKESYVGETTLGPTEKLDIRGIRHTWGMIYGLEDWESFFTPRQLLSLVTLSRLVRDVFEEKCAKDDFSKAVVTCLALTVDKVADLANSVCGWEPVAECPRHLFARQAVPITWDFAEGVATGDASGSWAVLLERFGKVLSDIGSDWTPSIPAQASATHHPLPDDAANAFITDPPYYDAVPYAYLSDFFYVWLRRNLLSVHPGLFKHLVVPKDEEIVVDRPHQLSNSTHDIFFYERELTKAFSEGRRVLMPDGIGTIVFASKTTASWEAILKAVIDAGWIITGSWPIDTEMANRVSAQSQARLASSIHLVCRPRENPDGSVREDDVGYWSDVLAELPLRIHAWLPGLDAEGVVGADAIFSCLGPALEIYSRYSRVEKASGEVVTLKEYLEAVWAAVSHEALGMIFSGAEATGLEEDARLTAMWLWTLFAGADNGDSNSGNNNNEGETDEDKSPKSTLKGFVLEYDAARKIAQGMGVKKLENLPTLVEVKGDKARLLPVSERTSYLFGQGSLAAKRERKKKKEQQTTLSGGVVSQAQDETSGPSGELSLPAPGSTVLDRLHQAMLLFSNGRSDALKRFIEEDISQDQGLWSLAQSLSALYPAGSEERRWVEGVLTRKKSLGI